MYLFDLLSGLDSMKQKEQLDLDFLGTFLEHTPLGLI